MWIGETSLLRLLRSVGILAVLAVAVVVLHTDPGALSAAIPNCKLKPNGFWDCGETDCMRACDVAYYNPVPPNLPPGGCADTCCVRQQDGSYDCSGCPGCGETYKNCVFGCFGGGGGSECINPARCDWVASNVYTQCITNAPFYGCLDAEGSVIQGCCEAESLWQHFNCCYP